MSTFYVINDANSINNTVVNGNGLQLGAGDSVFVKSNGAILETGLNGTGIYINGLSDGSSATVAGTVYGDQIGIYSLGTNAHITVTGEVFNGIFVNGTGDRVTIGNTGYVCGSMGISGQNSVLDNAGMIDLGGGEIHLNNQVFITNHGLIASTSDAFAFEGGGTANISNFGDVHGSLISNLESTDALNIWNYGSWLGGGIYSANGDDSITNLGTIEGTISFKSGNDMLDSHDGHVYGYVFGGAGNDYIVMGSEDNSVSGGAGADFLDGGAGVNTLDYSDSALSVTVDLLHNLARHGDAAGDKISHFQNLVGSIKGDNLTGTDGNNDINGLLGNDNINGLGGDDTITLLGKTKAHLNGGNGDDTFHLQTADAATYGAAFTAGMQIDGGTGFDTVELTGAANVIFNATTMVNVERIQMEDGFNFVLATNDVTVAGGQTTQVDATALSSFVLNFNGSAELDGSFAVDGGGGGAKDFIQTGAGADVIQGGGNIDTLTGGAGADTFVYLDVSDSTSNKYDIVTDFNASMDHFSMPDMPSAMDAMVASGTLTAGSFNNDLKAVLNGHLLANDAILFHATAGGLAGPYHPGGRCQR